VANVSDLFAFGCAAVAAFGNALANVMQRKASLQQGTDRSFGPRLLLDLLRRPIWLIGFGGMVASFVLQAVALGLGQLSAVEPILTLEVPLTLFLASRLFRTGLGRTEWAGIVIMTAGMILLVTTLDPHPGDEVDVAASTELLAGSATAATVVMLVLVSRRGTATWRTACLGAAAGTSFGLTATLIKATLGQAGAHGVVGALATWSIYAAILCGVTGVIVMQWALHSGPLLAAQPGFTLMDPLVSIFWGVLVFNEMTRTGPVLIFATVGGIAVGAGVLVLARSPLLSATVRSVEPAPSLSS
jgi:drug/metabolite transporter (DMT)-like permease